MAGQNLSAFDAVLKDVYVGPIRDQLNQKTVLLDAFTKGDVEKVKWEGRQVIIPLHSSRNYSGVLAVAENGQLPVAGSQGYKDLKIPMNYVYGRIQLTAQVIKQSLTDRAAFAQAMSTEQKGLVSDIARQRNRYLSYYGSAVLAQITAGATSATQTVNNPGGVSGSVNGTRFLKAGMIVAVYTDNTGATVSFVDTISSVTDANTIVFASSHTTVTGAVITLATNGNSATQGSYGIEPMGVLGIVDSTTYVSSIDGIDRSQAANAFFRSNILSSVGTLSMDIIQRGIDNTEEVSGEVIDRWYSHSSVRREVLKITDADRRYADQASRMSPDPGTKAGTFKEDLPLVGMGVKVVKDFAYGTLMGVNKEHMLWYALVEGEWADDDGTVLLRTAGVDAYEARYRIWENFGSDKGNSHLRMDGITATVTSGVYSD